MFNIYNVYITVLEMLVLVLELMVAYIGLLQRDLDNKCHLWWVYRHVLSCNVTVCGFSYLYVTTFLNILNIMELRTISVEQPISFCESLTS